MMKLLILCLSFCSFALAQTISVTVDGKKHASITMEEIRKLKTNEVEFFNHVTKRAELYKGVPTLSLIERLYPDSNHILEIELISSNDFRYNIPMERLQLAHSILAFERADGDKFVRFSQKEKILVDLGPLYLVWDLKNVSAQDRLNFSSDYQIGAINLVTNRTDFGVNETSVDASVYLGFQTYKSRCLSCHSLGKLGGNMSFDLLKRKTLQMKGHDYVIKYILDPKSVNPQTRMLPLPKFKNSNEMAQGVVDFLKFMQNPEELLNKKKASSSGTSYKALKNIVNEMR
jgi:hypothetical protein